MNSVHFYFPFYNIECCFGTVFHYFFTLSWGNLVQVFKYQCCSWCPMLPILSTLVLWVSSSYTWQLIGIGYPNFKVPRTEPRYLQTHTPAPSHNHNTQFSHLQWKIPQLHSVMLWRSAPQPILGFLLLNYDSSPSFAPSMLLLHVPGSHYLLLRKTEEHPVSHFLSFPLICSLFSNENILKYKPHDMRPLFKRLQQIHMAPWTKSGVTAHIQCHLTGYMLSHTAP